MTDLWLPVKLRTTDKKGIALATRKDARIANWLGDAQLEEYEIKKYERTRQYIGGWQARKPPCGIYNCYGLVFASRRTSIHDDQLDLIREHDEYRELDKSEPASVGDIILYEREGVMCHAGILVKSTNGTLQVLSKMGSTGGEEIHDISNRLDRKGGHFKRYWTDRGKQEVAKIIPATAADLITLSPQ